MISRLLRTAVLAAIGAAVFTAVRRLTQPADQLPTPAAPTGGPWPPLRPEAGAPGTAGTEAPSTGTTAPPATGRVTTPQSARPAPAEAPGEAEGPAPADPTKADTTPAPTPAEQVGAPAVVPEPDGTPIADTTDTAPVGTSAPTDRSWVESDDEGNCPDDYPIKANMKSKIFHSPGQVNYDRTNPDRCYIDSAAAEADGLRPAKR